MWGVLKKDLAEFVGTVTGEAREALATVLQQEEGENEEQQEGEHAAGAGGEGTGAATGKKVAAAAVQVRLVTKWGKCPTPCVLVLECSHDHGGTLLPSFLCCCCFGSLNRDS
jgi:hypothetical protein